VGNTDNPNYCLYHKMLGHPTKSCYVFKDILQVLINAEVLKLRPEQKKVTTNMTSFLQVWVQPPQSSSHPERGTKGAQYRSTHQREKVFVPISTPQGEIMWVHPDLMEDQQ